MPPAAQRRIEYCGVTMDIASKKVFLFDIDGTLCIGKQAIPGAAELLRALRRAGKRVLFLTNNTTCDVNHICNTLRGAGLDADQAEIMTAGDDVLSFLQNERADKTVYVLGTAQFRDTLRRGGVNVMSDAEAAATDADVVLSSFDTSVTYEKIRYACRMIENGAEYLSSHPDLRCPSPDGFIPDSGALAAMISAVVAKQPRFFGKPGEHLMKLVIARTEARPQEMCMFGDRLYTDIATGHSMGVTSVLVLTGEATAQDAEAAMGDQRPDYVFPSVMEVYRTLFSE